MSDEFGTVSVRSGARAREIEMVRQHYMAHREALASLAGEAPSEHLAAEYHRLVADIDASMRKLDELEGRAPAAAAPPPHPARATAPADRPLVVPPTTGYDTSPGTPGSGARVFLIVLVGLVVLAAIGWMIWRASSDRRTPEQSVVIDTSATTSTTPSTGPVETGTVVPAVTPAPAPWPATGTASLRVAPAVQDYGIIRRGTRAVRQFEVTNSGTIPVRIQVARSNCRCLYYAFSDKPLAPGAHDTVTVTVDAARAKTPTIE